MAAKARPRRTPADRAAEAEAELLGAILFDPTAFEKVQGQGLRAHHFASAAYSVIYDAVVHVHAVGGLTDVHAVLDRLEATNQLEAIGGRGVLSSLIGSTASSVNVTSYARHVLEHAARRSAADIGARLQRAAVNSVDVTIADLIRHAREELLDLDLEQGDDQSVLVNGSSVTPSSHSWLWKYFLARGKCHMLGGPPGSAKTTVSMAITATVTTGGRWPDGTPSPIGDVLIWSGEDDIDDTLLPRLLAMGADVSRVHFVGDIGKGAARREFDPSSDLPALERSARKISNVALLIVDPVVMALGNADSHKNAETRRSLQPLVALAKALNAALIGITHFTKGSAARDPLERITGSIAFGALPRVVFGVVKSAEDGLRRFVRVKSNIGPDGGGFIYTLEQKPLAGYPEISASCVTWGESLEGPASELLAVAEATEDQEERSAQREAEEFLREELIDGRVPAKELVQKARGQGISERTLKRARQNLGVVSRKSGDRWYLALPDQQGQNTVTRKDGPLGPLEAGSRSQSQEGQEGQENMMEHF
jgi:putative DNA primase/helicase